MSGCSSPEKRAQNYYDSGMALIAKNDDLNARLELLNAVKYKSDKIEAWRALAGVDERTKAGQLLFQDLRRIVELDPTDLDARLKLVRIMAGAGAADAALKVVEAANEGDKPSAELHALKASILARTNDITGAVREAQRALEIDPKNVNAVMFMAAKKLSDKDADGALALVNTLPTDPKIETQISLLKIQALVQKRDLPLAETLLRKLVAENPGERGLKEQLVQLYIAERRFNDAEKELRAAANADPSDSRWGLELVRFLIAVKGAAAGKEELDARIKAGGDVFDYQVTKAEFDFSQGKVAEATEQLKALLSAATVAERKLAIQAKLAEIYVSRSNFAGAEPIITEILQNDRRNIVALRLRATMRIEQGQFDAAISDLREALNDQPKQTDLLLLMAASYERSGKNELAERQYADALKASGFNPNVGLKYIAFLQRRNEVAHAEEILTEIAERNPRNLEVLGSLAQIKLSQKNWAGALAVADTIGALNDGQALADQVRASAFAGQNKNDQSVAALEAAHSVAPNALQPVVSLVSTYIRLGKAEVAETLLKDMLSKHPDSAELLVLLGQTKLAQNRPEDALQNFKAAIAKQPKDPNGYNALAGLYVRQKNYDSASDVIQAGLREQPTNLNFRFSSAGILILKGDSSAAMAQYESILQDQPRSLLAINNLVSLILDNRSDKESLDRAFSLAESLKNSNVPQFQDTYGWMLFKKGDYNAAVSILEAAQTKLPKLAAVHYHLGMSYAAAGQSEKAAEQFQTASNLEPDGTSLKELIRRR